LDTSDGRGEGTGCTSGEVTAAGLADSRGAVDGLSVDPGIGWLVAK